MEVRVFGRAGMRLSVLGCGCGAVGGLYWAGFPQICAIFQRDNLR
jgi:hypothetical protein